MLGEGEFAFAVINIAELEVMIGVIDVMDFGFEFFDPGAAAGAGQFKAAHRGGGTLIDLKIIPERRDAPADEDEERPDPFAIAQGVKAHPDLEREDRQQQGAAKQIIYVVE